MATQKNIEALASKLMNADNEIYRIRAGKPMVLTMG